MIWVRICINRTEAELIMKGHAGYAEGPDIVCAAASVLAFTFCQRLSDMEAEGYLDIFHAEPKSGNAYAYGEARSPAGVSKLIGAAKTILAGFELLERKYPENVKLTLAGNVKGWGETDD